MCYSAQIKAECLSFLRQWGAALSLPEFVDLYWRRTTDAKVKIPRALYTLFAQPTSADERLIRELMEPPEVAAEGHDRCTCRSRTKTSMPG